MQSNNFNHFLETLSFTPTDILGIDGPCGSGKTTLSDLIANLHDVDVIHLDDFFLPLELRTSTRLSEIGGNVHYERFYTQVIKGILSGVPFSYQQFRCDTMSYVNEVSIKNNKPIVIEGSYSLRPDFRSIYTKKIFLDIDSTTQKQRLIKRVGKENYPQFQDLWIPKEDAYFRKFQIREIADILL